jgi:hypothetical protein
MAPHLVTDATEDGEARFFRPLPSRGDFKAVMKPVCVAGRHRTGLFGVITEGQHVVKWLVAKFVNVFGPVPGNVDADLFHDGGDLRANSARHKAGSNRRV